MRFVDLEVTAFQAIASARVEFAPGLNVLYGPNDLGKSTLVTALRAALLIPAKSSEGNAFRPWFRDAIPRVVLTFEADDGRFWRVTKEFGDGSAELKSSKDGTNFTMEAKAREVDAKLRSLLEWGVPSPGGKSGPRGAPDSFLVNALLAGQAEVETILGKSLEGDLADTGKVRLTRALSALAQDPLFKKVLQTAQAEVDAFFTTTGRKKSGAKSRFTVVGERVKALQVELAHVRTQLEQSASTEAMVNELRERSEAAHSREREALSLVEVSRRGVEQSRARVAAEAKVHEARVRLQKIDEVLARGAALARELKQLELASAHDEAAKTKAEALATECANAVRAAEEALQRVSSEAGARERELKRATLSSRLSELGATIARLEAQRDKALAAAERRKTLDAANAEHLALTKELAALDAKFAGAQQSADLAHSILDYGRWRDAVRGSERVIQSRREATELENKAKALLEKVSANEVVLGKAERAILDTFPSSAEISKLATLEQDLKLAEARIGGGLTVAVRPRDELRLHLEIDDEAPIDEVARADKERTFEAERKLALTIGQMVEIEVTAGSKQDRQTRDALSKRWRTESRELFARAEVNSVVALQARQQELERERDALKVLRTETDRLKADAASASQQAQLLLRDVTSGVSAEELQRRRDRIPEAQLALLAKAFESMGAEWEREAESLEAGAKKELAALNESVSKKRGLLAAAEERRKASMPAKDEPTEATLQATQKELASCATERSTVEAALKALEAEQGAEVKSAQRALDETKQKALAAEQAKSAATKQLELSRASLNEKRGQVSAQQAEADRLDRPGAQRAFDEAQAVLKPLLSTPLVTPEQLAETERILAAIHAETVEADAEFNKADGALSKVGGPQVREQVQNLEEALAAARAQEAEVELDAESWRLLQETLREAENAEGGHLGRALSGPVAEQFQELTRGRYGAVELGPGLTTASITASGASTDGTEVLKALSVGTRDQLASLVRVAIARQLKSALVLDDHLVHTDAARMGWFVDVLRKTALDAQVLVFTCRPLDYVTADVLPGEVTKDLAGGSLRLVDLGRSIEGWPERNR
ncbi:MAG: AAA family ATPase [Myxococcales bacterium]|nr:AAA family ATPase [Myxococcales bacterium]